MFYLNSKTLIFLIVSVVMLLSCDNKKTKREKAEFYFRRQRSYPQGTIKEQKYLDKAIEADSSFASVYVEKSVSYNKRGNYSKGFSLLNKGVKLDPEYNLGYRGFVKLYMLRDYKGALADFVRLDSLTPNFQDAPWGEDIYKLQGICLMKLGEKEEAKKKFDLSISTISGANGEDWIEPRTFLYRGIIEYEEKQYALAIHFFDKFLKYTDNGIEGYLYKIRSYLKLNRDKVARTMLDSIDKNYPNINNIQTNPYFELPYQIYPSDIIETRKSLRLKK